MLLRPKAVRSPQSGECSICFEPLKKSKFSLQLSCGHTYHFKCLRRWQKEQPNCPLCRASTRYHCYHHVYPYAFSKYNHKRFPSLFNVVLKELKYYYRECPITVFADFADFEEFEPAAYDEFVCRLCPLALKYAKRKIETLDHATYFNAKSRFDSMTLDMKMFFAVDRVKSRV